MAFLLLLLWLFPMMKEPFLFYGGEDTWVLVTPIRKSVE